MHFLIHTIFLIPIIFLFAINYAQADSITIDGIERTYELHIPRGIDFSKPVPLLLVLHGGGGQGKGMIKLTGFNDVAVEYKFIVVYPDGFDKHWNDGREINTSIKDGKKVDDVLFISKLIDTLQSLYNIDNNKVFVTGISNGGFMCFRLACEIPEKITAIATVASSMTVEQYSYCNPSLSIPVMIISGDQDPLVPFEGGEIGFKLLKKRGKVVSVKETVEFWVKNNECKPEPNITTVDILTDEGTKAINYLYSGGKNNSMVNYWLIEGGGHTWPGGYQYLPKSIIGRTSKQIDASEEIWKFFSGLLR